MRWSVGSWRETWPRGRAVGVCDRKGCMDGGREQREGKGREGLLTAEGDCTHDPHRAKIDGNETGNANAGLDKNKEFVQTEKEKK